MVSRVMNAKRLPPGARAEAEGAAVAVAVAAPGLGPLTEPTEGERACSHTEGDMTAELPVSLKGQRLGMGGDERKLMQATPAAPSAPAGQRAS